MEAHRALLELARIHHAMHGIGWVDRTGVRQIHLDGIERFEPAASSLQILVDEVKVFDQEARDGNRHPAILIAMIVHGTGLPGFPADGHQFVEGCAVDQVARVMLPIPG